MEPHVYAFGQFRIDLSSWQLVRGGVLVPLPAKALEALVLLIRHRDRIVSNDELTRALWPDVLVADDRLIQTISLVQRTLGDTEVIATNSPRGYRFIVPVIENPPPDWDQLRAGTGVRPRMRKLRPVVSRKGEGSSEAGARKSVSRLTWLLVAITVAAIVALFIIANWPSLLAP
jgi:DNA-binding winged helix-turn-helix (wHTH) protein